MQPRAAPVPPSCRTFLCVLFTLYNTEKYSRNNNQARDSWLPRDRPSTAIATPTPHSPPPMHANRE